MPIYISHEILRPYFNLPLRAAADALGVCPTSIKKACRKLGIERWPRKGIIFSGGYCYSRPSAECEEKEEDWTKGYEGLWEAALLDRAAAFWDDRYYYWHDNRRLVVFGTQ